MTANTKLAGFARFRGRVAVAQVEEGLLEGSVPPATRDRCDGLSVGVGGCPPQARRSRAALGSDDGIELSDGDVILWDKLTELLQKLNKTIGPINIPPPLPQGVPKVTLCLSSCSAFSAYKKATSRPTPFQAIVGPIRDIGWCESMLAFASFYYTTNVMRKPYASAVMCMNFANGSVIGDGPIFETWNWFEDGDRSVRVAAAPHLAR